MPEQRLQRTRQAYDLVPPWGALWSYRRERNVSYLCPLCTGKGCLRCEGSGVLAMTDDEGGDR